MAPRDSEAGGARRPRRGIAGLIAVGALVLFGLGIWYAYERGVQSGGDPPPLIKADQSPAKIVPENRGGMQVPNQDKKIYQRIAGAQPAPAGVERLLPPPEAPRPEPTPTPPSAPEMTSEPTDTPPSAPTVESAPEPATAKPLAPAPLPAAPPSPAAAAPAAPPQPAAPPAPVAKPAGDVWVQIASYRETASAESAWKRLQKQLPEILRGLSPRYERADLGSKGVFHRLQAGPFPDRDAAEAACRKLKAAKQGCIVVN